MKGVRGLSRPCHNLQNCVLFFLTRGNFDVIYKSVLHRCLVERCFLKKKKKKVLGEGETEKQSVWVWLRVLERLVSSSLEIIIIFSATFWFTCRLYIVWCTLPPIMYAAYWKILIIANVTKNKTLTNRIHNVHDTI